MATHRNTILAGPGILRGDGKRPNFGIRPDDTPFHNPLFPCHGRVLGLGNFSRGGSRRFCLFLSLLFITLLPPRSLCGYFFFGP